jgi:GT2 family glycosyltransferase
LQIGAVENRMHGAAAIARAGKLAGKVLPEIPIHVEQYQRAACVQADETRPHVHGKFLFVGNQKFWIRGVTYGPFRPDPAGVQFPPLDVVERDFRAMASAGLNSVRVYTTPPRWVMDTAATHGLRVMIGLPWEQHVTFLDDRARARRILSDMRASVSRLADHPAVLCYAVGNEIPAPVVRWYGKARIERFIRQLCAAVKSEDAAALVTYVNFPTTEYLNLPFLDFVAFNVYLETKDTLGSYLARLQNLAGERPLVMAELGLDSKRDGEALQAERLEWQITTAFESGCAGAFIFAWTDEWFRGGHDITDWDFGLTTWDRRPKKALASVAMRFANVPFPLDRLWPRVSVVVCSHNGSRTIGGTLAGLEHLAYPDYEIIVIDDGSTDQTSAIASKHKVTLIRTDHNGLSAARNRGMNAATGEIIAYIDDDAYPDPHWLTYLASSFLRTEHVGIGGPNLAPPGDGAIADCVANAPGGPVHVLLSDEIAEHIPGCNMAYRREKLLGIGGFDPRFRVAGDDVDICWRLQERGWTLGYAPTAVVWHRRRNSIKTYFKQQRGYAKAEALLAEKWPAKYNSAGHLTWRGRLYGRGVIEALFARSRIYHGVWGSAPFQSVYERSSGKLLSLTLMPEWYFVLMLFGFLTALGTSWAPLLWLTPLFLAGASLTLIQAACAGRRAVFHPEPRSKLRRAGLQLLVAWLHLVQPAARLLRPWSWKGFTRIAPLPTIYSLWSVRWEAVESRLTQLQSCLREAGVPVVPGGDFDSWDLSICGGLFGTVRVVAMVEEHGNGQQLCRFRAWPKVPPAALAVLLSLVTLAGLAALAHAWVAGASLGLAAGALGLLIYVDCAIAMSVCSCAFDTYLGRNSSSRIVARPSWKHYIAPRARSDPRKQLTREIVQLRATHPHAPGGGERQTVLGDQGHHGRYRTAYLEAMMAGETDAEKRDT